jgi:hypothetical protein
MELIEASWIHAINRSGKARGRAGHARDIGGWFSRLGLCEESLRWLVSNRWSFELANCTSGQSSLREIRSVPQTSLKVPSRGRGQAGARENERQLAPCKTLSFPSRWVRADLVKVPLGSCSLTPPPLHREVASWRSFLQGGPAAFW